MVAATAVLASSSKRQPSRPSLLTVGVRASLHWPTPRQYQAGTRLGWDLHNASRDHEGKQSCKIDARVRPASSMQSMQGPHHGFPIPRLPPTLKVALVQKLVAVPNCHSHYPAALSLPPLTGEGEVLAVEQAAKVLEPKGKLSLHQLVCRRASAGQDSCGRAGVPPAPSGRNMECTQQPAHTQTKHTTWPMYQWRPWQPKKRPADQQCSPPEQGCTP